MLEAVEISLKNSGITAESFSIPDNTMTLVTGSRKKLGALINTLNLFALPKAGSIVFDSKVVDKKNAEEIRAQKIVTIYSSLPVIEGKTIKEIAQLVFDFLAKPYSEVELQKAFSLVSLCFDAKLLEQRPAELSRFEQMKLHLAFAALKSPKLLLLDNPFTQTRDDEELFNILRILSKKISIIVFCTEKESSFDYDQIFRIEKRRLIKEKTCPYHTKDFKTDFVSFLPHPTSQIPTPKERKLSRLLATLVSFVTILYLTLLTSFHTFDENAAALMMTNETTAILTCRNRKWSHNGRGYYYIDSGFNDEQKAEIENYTRGICSPISDLKFSFSDLIASCDFEATGFLTDKAVEIEEADLDGVGLTPIDGVISSRLPVNYAEIAISDAYAESVLEFGIYEDREHTSIYHPVDKEDLLGYKVLGEYEITGIYKTEDKFCEKRADFFKKEHTFIQKAYDDMELSGFSLGKYIYVAKDYWRFAGLPINQITSYFVNLKGNRFSDYRFVRSLRKGDKIVFVENNYTSSFFHMDLIYEHGFSNSQLALWLFAVVFIVLMLIVTAIYARSAGKGLQSSSLFLFGLGYTKEDLKRICRFNSEGIAFKVFTSVAVVYFILALIFDVITRFLFFSFTWNLVLSLLLMLFLYYFFSSTLCYRRVKKSVIKGH